MNLTSLKDLLSTVTKQSPKTTNILAYWEALEYFQEITFPRPAQDAEGEEIKVKYIASEEELEGFIHHAKRDENKFRLYVSGVSKFELLSALYNCIPPVEDNKRFRKLLEKNREVSVLYTIDLSAEGKYEEGSFQLSPYIWAISCLLHDREIIEDNLEPLLRDGNEFFQSGLTDKPCERLWEKAKQLLVELRIRHLFIASDLFRRKDLNKICIRSSQENDTDLNMSFYAKDLSRIRKSLLEHEPAGLLNAYINAPSDSVEGRQSICSIENYRKWLQPEKYPMGRWPSEFPPALMQQMAINLAVAEERDGGCRIFSVNGPPGTGKTTLLKDIIAEYVVRRARLLAELNKPDDAFTYDTLLEKALGNRTQCTYAFKANSGFDNYGILVASCNNAAVENITFELPDMSKLPKAEVMEAAGHTTVFSQGKDFFFGELATNMLNNSLEPKKQTKKAWGLISARLGKSENIRSFNEMVLKQFGMKTSSKAENRETAAEFKGRFPAFRDAKREFLEQYRLVETLRGQQHCNEAVFQADNEKMQPSNPLVNAAFDKAREELFYRALVLHGSFIVNSYKWKCNLYSLRYLWEGQYSAEEKELIFPHLLNSLFYLVPVVSTTFASVQKMLEYIGREQLGLLIVDEAGQAAPQCAVGALWRARKAIIVGDPKQVEPVVTTDETLMSVYQRKCRVDELAAYMSKSHSVQGFADRINPYGAWIGETWVGCPLVVHRRCINPMFSIANRVSYDGTMILGTKDEVKEEERKDLLFGHSLWIDVPSSPSIASAGSNHYVPEQGELCLRIILSWMKKHNVKGDNRKLYVISPFTTVINGVKTAVRKALRLKENEALLPKYKSWADANCGTVHKFQGKEAEEVIFLLGCQPSSTGAIAWVNSNILNVAVTRAKKRVYFIGDYEVWSQKNGNFNSRIIRFSDEDTGLQRLSYKELPPFGDVVTPADTTAGIATIEEGDIEEDNLPNDIVQELCPIPKYSFLTGPAYRKRHRVIYSHPYQFIFEILISDPAKVLPQLPASHYRKISEAPALWMCLIYPTDLDLTPEELGAELDGVIDWFMEEDSFR